MPSYYSIIIPIHNEEKYIPTLLNELKPYSNNNEIIIIDDGSNDLSNSILLRESHIKLIHFQNNKGKGSAIIEGIKNSKYDKILISDGDLELKTDELENLMILSRSKNINCVFGARFKKIDPFVSFWNFGNYFFTVLFNFIFKVDQKDALCCAKSFFKSDLNINEIKSKKFDIDVELAIKLIQKYKSVKIVQLTYRRRKINQGKKLSLIDGFLILRRILL